MGKMSKKIVSFVLVLAMCFSVTVVANAQEIDKDKLRYGEREVVTVLKTEYCTTTVTPSGQVPGGYCLPVGGGIYVNTSGGGSISVSLGMTWGIVNVSASVGTAGDSSSVGGLLLPVPDSTNYYSARVDQTYKVEYKQVDCYKYNEYVQTYYISVPTLYKVKAYLVKK